MSSIVLNLFNLFPFDFNTIKNECSREVINETDSIGM